GPLARLHVLARNTEFAVTLLAEGLAALAVRGLQCGRVHLVFPLVPGVACGHARAGALLELGQRRAGQHVGVPRLEVRSGRRPTRGGQHTLQHLPRDMLVGESAHRPSARDRLIDVQDQPPSAPLSLSTSLMLTTVSVSFNLNQSAHYRTRISRHERVRQILASLPFAKRKVTVSSTASARPVRWRVVSNRYSNEPSVDR